MNIHDISSTIDRAFVAAKLDPESARLAAVSKTIRKALDAAGLTQSPSSSHAAEMPVAPRSSRVAKSRTRLVDDAPAQDVGSFTRHTYSNGTAQRDYQLYVPSTAAGQPMPLIVMLHGCKQSPEDFAAGTRMNALAEAHGFLVAYPAQTARANGGNCWNWFNRAEQSRDGEEPSLIAGMARHVGESHAVDSSRVFAAGLSAGGAMAAIVAAAYPDVFKAIAVHSGLPVGAAHDVMSAFSAMNGRPDAQGEMPMHAVPTMVIHGESDSTVAASNGHRVVEQALRAFEADTGAVLQPQVATQSCADGRPCTVTRYVDAQGRAPVEAWFINGAGHAWSGGSPEGSFTDAKGPDASAEIVRFFLGH